MLRGERPVQADFDQADLFAVGVEVIDGFFNGVAHGTHRDDNLFGIARAVVVEQLVFGADSAVDLVHVVFGDLDNFFVIGVAGFARLEEDVRVLRRAAQHGMLRVQRAAAEGVDGIHIHHFGQFFVIPHVDFLNFMRGSEAVEEMHKRHTALDGGKMKGLQYEYLLPAPINKPEVNLWFC